MAADAPVASSTMTWKQAVRRARELEAALEAALPEYAKLASSPHQEAKRREDESRLAARIEADLRELRLAIEAMAATQEPTLTAQAVVQRTRDVYVEHDEDYKRHAAVLRRERDRAALFAGASPEIPSADDADPESGGMEPLLKERAHVRGAMRGVAAVLAQGAEAREALARQRQSLAASDTSIAGLAHALPSVDDVITAMQQKKTRHNAIIGTTIGCCASFLLWAIIH